jgi:hypothetical protein
VSATCGLTDTLAADWQKAARFYARFGITEAMFRKSVPPSSIGDEVDLPDLPRPPEFVLDELRARESTTLPFSGSGLYGHPR